MPDCRINCPCHDHQGPCDSCLQAKCWRAPELTVDEHAAVVGRLLGYLMAMDAPAWVMDTFTRLAQAADPGPTEAPR